jgi:hypothetical protein
MEVPVWVGTTAGAICTIFFLTYVIKENVLYRFSEHTMLGLGVGVGTAVAVKSIIDTAITPLSGGDYLMIVPIIMGILLYTRLYEPVAYMSRWPTALMVGIGITLGARAAFDATILKQLAISYNKFVGADATGMVVAILFLVMLVAALTYFFFLDAIYKRLGFLKTIGRWVIMLAFGVTFGNEILTRFGMLLGVQQYLLWTWLGLKPA